MIIPAASFTFDAYQAGEYGDHCIVHGDCRDVLPLIPDKAIDLVLTDPPYGISNSNLCNEITRKHSINSDVVPFENEWDKESVKGWEGMVTPKLSERGALFVFHAQQQRQGLRMVFDNLGLRFKSCFYWVKHPGGLNPRRSFVSRVEEAMFFVCGKQWAWNGGGSSCNYFIEDFCELNAPQNNHHPTQKPIRLVAHVLITISEDHQLVLDPFLGSGTTLVACKNLGRRGIGIEINRDFCAIAEQRLAQGVLEL